MKQEVEVSLDQEVAIALVNFLHTLLRRDLSVEIAEIAFNNARTAIYKKESLVDTFGIVASLASEAIQRLAQSQNLPVLRYFEDQERQYLEVWEDLRKPKKGFIT